MAGGSYADLLRQPGFPSLMGASLIARLPLGMNGLAIVLLVTRHGSYSRAGLVVALFVAGSGIAGPVLGRLVDRAGRARVLPPFATAEAVLLILLAALPAGDGAMQLACALGAGLCTPPVTSSARALWPVVLPAPQVAVVYALEASLQELSFIVGPSLVALAVSVGTPGDALAASAGVLVIGVYAFSFHPAARRLDERAGDRPEPGSPPPGGLFGMPLPLPLVAAAVALVGSFAVTELATVAFARSHHSPASAGLVLAAWSAGSLIGGLLLGIRASAWATTPRRVGALMAVVAAGAALPAAAGQTWTLGALLFAGGLTIAPTFGALFGLAGALAPPERQTEAFGWLAGGFQAGNAIGAASGGLVIQAAGSRPAFAIAAATVAAGAIGLAAGTHRRPQGVTQPVPPAREPSESGQG